MISAQTSHYFGGVFEVLRWLSVVHKGITSCKCGQNKAAARDSGAFSARGAIKLRFCAGKGYLFRSGKEKMGCRAEFGYFFRSGSYNSHLSRKQCPNMLGTGDSAYLLHGENKKVRILSGKDNGLHLWVILQK